MHYIKDSKGYYVSKDGLAYRNGSEIGSLGMNGYYMVRVYFMMELVSFNQPIGGLLRRLFQTLTRRVTSTTLTA